MCCCCIFTGAKKLGQGNVFTSICDSVNRGSASMHAGIPPPGPHPLDHTPRTTSPQDQNPPGEQTPSRNQTPPGTRTPLGSRPPKDQTPPRETDSGIRSTSGRYASYWNAFLFKCKFKQFFSMFTFCNRSIKYAFSLK